MPELHILIFLFFLSIISASIIPAQAELVCFAFLASGKYTPWLLITAACAGTVIGTGINWVLGRYLTHFQDKKWFPVKPEYLHKAEVLFSRHGKITLLLAGVPLIGDPITIAAGAAKTRFSYFISLAAPAKCCRFLIVWLIYLGIV